MLGSVALLVLLTGIRAEMRAMFRGLSADEGVSFVPAETSSGADIFVPPIDYSKTYLRVSERGPVSGCLPVDSPDVDTLGFYQQESKTSNVVSLYYFRDQFRVIKRLSLGQWKLTVASVATKTLLLGFETFQEVLVMPFVAKDSTPLQAIYYRDVDNQIKLKVSKSTDKFDSRESNFKLPTSVRLPKFPLNLALSHVDRSENWYLIASPTGSSTDTSSSNTLISFMYLESIEIQKEFVVDLASTVQSLLPEGQSLTTLIRIAADHTEIVGGGYQLIVFAGNLLNDRKIGVFSCIIKLDHINFKTESCTMIPLNLLTNTSIPQIGFYSKNPKESIQFRSAFVSLFKYGKNFIHRFNLIVWPNKSTNLWEIQIENIGETEDPLAQALSGRQMITSQLNHILTPSRTIMLDQGLYAFQVQGNRNRSTFVYSKNIDSIFSVGNLVFAINIDKCWSRYYQGQLRLNLDLSQRQESEATSSIVTTLPYINMTSNKNDTVITEVTLLKQRIDFNGPEFKVAGIVGLPSLVRNSLLAKVEGPLHTFRMEGAILPRVLTISYHEYDGEGKSSPMKDQYVVGTVDFAFSLKHCTLFNCRESSRDETTLTVVCFSERVYKDTCQRAGLIHDEIRPLSFVASEDRLAVVYSKRSATYSEMLELATVVLDRYSDLFIIENLISVEPKFTPRLILSRDYLYVFFSSKSGVSMLYINDKSDATLTENLLAASVTSLDARANLSVANVDIHLTLLSSNQVIDVRIYEGQIRATRIFYLPLDIVPSPRQICRLASRSLVFDGRSVITVGQEGQIFTLMPNSPCTVCGRRLSSLVCVNEHLALLSLRIGDNSPAYAEIRDYLDSNFESSREKHQTAVFTSSSLDSTDFGFVDGGLVFALDGTTRKTLAIGRPEDKAYLASKGQRSRFSVELNNLVANQGRILGGKISWIYQTQRNSYFNSSLKVNVSNEDNNYWKFNVSLRDFIYGHFWKITQTSGHAVSVVNRFSLIEDKTTDILTKKFAESYMPFYSTDLGLDVYGNSSNLIVVLRDSNGNSERVDTISLSSQQIKVQDVLAAAIVEQSRGVAIVHVVVKATLVDIKSLRLVMVMIEMGKEETKVSKTVLPMEVSIEDSGFKVEWQGRYPTVGYIQPYNQSSLVVVSFACPHHIILWTDEVYFFELIPGGILWDGIFVFYGRESDTETQFDFVRVEQNMGYCDEFPSQVRFKAPPRFFGAIRCKDTFKPDIFNCILAGKRIYWLTVQVPVSRDPIISDFSEYTVYKNFEPLQVEFARSQKNEGFVILGSLYAEKQADISPHDSSGLLFYEQQQDDEDDDVYASGGLTNGDLLKMKLGGRTKLWSLNHSSFALHSGPVIKRFKVNEVLISGNRLVADEVKLPQTFRVVGEEISDLKITFGGVPTIAISKSLFYWLAGIGGGLIILALCFVVFRKRQQAERDRIIGKYSSFALVTGIADNLSSRAPDFNPPAKPASA